MIRVDVTCFLLPYKGPWVCTMVNGIKCHYGVRDGELMYAYIGTPLTEEDIIEGLRNKKESVERDLQEIEELLGKP